MYLSIWLPTFLLYFCSLLLVGLGSQLLNASHIRESRPFQSKVIDLMRKTDICWAKLSISCFGRQSTKQETKCGTFMWQAMANHKFLVNLRLKLLIGKVCFFFESGGCGVLSQLVLSLNLTLQKYLNVLIFPPINSK